jgi:hypothetical protein
MQKTLLLGFLFFSLQTEAQSTVPAVTVTPATFNVGGGSSIINPSFMVDWSIGESTVIETFQGENPYPNSIVGTKWNVTSGIVQPFVKKHIIFNDLIPYWTNQEIRVYPVPTPNTVFIDFRSSTTGKISIQLMTLDGRILGVKEFIQVNGYSTQSWNIKNQPSGAYYLRIILRTFEGKIFKQGTFKIEKIQ